MSDVELFIEVRCEEIPARFVTPALEGLVAGLQKLLGGLLVGEPRVYSTPRRLAISARVLPARPRAEKVVTGMPIAQARSGEGWSPAALGFAKKRGVDPTEIFEQNGFAAVRTFEGGDLAESIVGAGLEALVLGIPFKKTMRWGESPVRFARPLHDVLCVLGGRRVDATVAGIRTTDLSVGHWLLSPAPFPVSDAARWVSDLRERGVWADRTERQERVSAQLAVAAGAEGLHLQADDALLDEVVNLVESPKVIVGRFPEALLELPPRLLIESMKLNQRYFPLFTQAGKLTNAFLVVTNNPEGNPQLIAEGNARVLAARFDDARFFYAEDRKKTLRQHAERLAGMVWIRGMGTMVERQAEITAAGMRLASRTGADPRVVERLGLVLKADLATSMVGEFPELQGHVGHLLAVIEGYDEAPALEEAWLPRFSGDALPRTGAGLALALAERMTLLSRCFEAEMEPKGSADPQGLRRAAVGLVALILALPQQEGLSAGALFAEAGVPLPATLSAFITARLRAVMLAEGHPTDIVDAVLTARGSDPGAAAARIRGLAGLPKDELAAVRTTFRRVAGLAKDHGSAVYALDLLQGEPEYQLHLAVKALGGGDRPAADMLAALRDLRPLVDRFFDGVLVMCDDLPLRANRLGMLRTILDRFSGFAAFSRLGGE